MSSLRRLVLFSPIIAMLGGCDVQLELPAFAAQPAGFAQAADFPNPPLPLGSPMVLVAQPAPQISPSTPVYVPGIGVIYVRP